MNHIISKVSILNLLRQTEKHFTWHSNQNEQTEKCIHEISLIGSRQQQKLSVRSQFVSVHREQTRTRDSVRRQMQATDQSNRAMQKASPTELRDLVV
jgi:hypothetical protein